MNFSLPRLFPRPFILPLAVAAIFAPARACAFDIIAKLERDGNANSGPSEHACTLCTNNAKRASASFSGGFPPPPNPVAVPANSQILGTAFADLSTGVMRGNAHAASYGNNEQHQIRFISRIEESITISVPVDLPDDQRYVTITGNVHAGAAATNRATAESIYSLQVQGLYAAVSLNNIEGWHVLSGGSNPAIEITPFAEGHRFTIRSFIPNNGVVSIQSQLEGTAWAEARFTTGVGMADVNASDTASLTMVLPEGASYTSTSGVFLKPSAIQAWRQQYFGSPENSGPGADAADPDGDGTVNLLEFAILTNPLIATALPVSHVLAGENLEFTYPRNKAAIGDVTFAGEFSDTLAAGSWSTAGVTEFILSDDGTVQQIKAIVPADALRRFVRLSVTSAGP